MCVGFRNSLFSSPDSRSACLPVLVITFHVFVFIVFASLDDGRVTTLLLASARHSCTYPFACVNCESPSSGDGRGIGQQQAEIQSIQIPLQDPEARSSEAFAVGHQHPRRVALK